MLGLRFQRYTAPRIRTRTTGARNSAIFAQKLLLTGGQLSSLVFSRDQASETVDRFLEPPMFHPTPAALQSSADGLSTTLVGGRGRGRGSGSNNAGRVGADYIFFKLTILSGSRSDISGTQVSYKTHRISPHVSLTSPTTNNRYFFFNVGTAKPKVIFFQGQ